MLCWTDSNSKTTGRAACLVAAFLLMTPLPAAADAALHLRIDFELQAPNLTNIWRDKSTPRDALREHLVAEMKNRFRHWSIGSATAENEITVVFRVLEVPTKGITVIMFTFYDSDGKIEDAEADRPWLKQGELISLAPLFPQDALPMIKDQFGELLDEYKLLIDGVLRDRVALATGGQWQENQESGELELVVPLSWSRHKRLREARFRVACIWAQIGSVNLLTKGRGRKARYAAETGEAAFDAIVTKPTKRIVTDEEVTVRPEIYDEVRQLTLGGIYLAPDERQSGRFVGPN